MEKLIVRYVPRTLALSLCWSHANLAAAAPTVGAYYYPWWGEGISGGHHFQYLAQNVFNDPNYMRIDGRPVVVMYLSRVSREILRRLWQSLSGYSPCRDGDPWRF